MRKGKDFNAISILKIINMSLMGIRTEYIWQALKAQEKEQEVTSEKILINKNCSSNIESIHIHVVNQFHRLKAHSFVLPNWQKKE